MMSCGCLSMHVSTRTLRGRRRHLRHTGPRAAADDTALLVLVLRGKPCALVPCPLRSVGDGLLHGGDGRLLVNMRGRGQGGAAVFIIRAAVAVANCSCVSGDGARVRRDVAGGAAVQGAVMCSCGTHGRQLRVAVLLVFPGPEFAVA